MSAKNFLSKSNFVTDYAEISGSTLGAATEDVNSMIQTFNYYFTKCAKGKQEMALNLPGLGTFYLKKTKPCQRKNPKTGEVVDVPAGMRVSFKASNPLKKDIKEAFNAVS